MHFHLPKPLHGWREFAGEVGIIVIGVLIALGAEQVVEQVSWREKVRTADDAIQDEVGSNAINLGERLAVQSCLRQQIARLADQLNKNEGRWTAAPVALNASAIIKQGGVVPVLAPAYRPPSRIWLDDRWTSARVDGTLAHLPPQRAQGYEIIYRNVNEMNVLQTEEASAASRLSYLSSDRRLSENDRATFFAALAEVDRVNSLMAIVSSQTLTDIALLHLGFDKREVDQAEKSTINYEQSLRGSCVRPMRLNLN